MIESISHITFMARDLDRAREFFTYILMQEKLTQVEIGWINLIIIIVFKIDEEDYDMHYERLDQYIFYNYDNHLFELHTGSPDDR